VSSTTSDIILFCSDPKRSQEIKLLFVHDNVTKTDFGGYYVDYSTVSDQVIIAQLSGSAWMDTDALLEKLRSCNPELLLLSSHNDHVGETQITCLKNGKKCSKKTLVNNIRKASPQANLYFSIMEEETQLIEGLIKDDSIDLDMHINGSPLLLYIMELGSIKVFKEAVNRGANIHARFMKNDWFGFTKIVEGMNLLSIAIQLNLKSIFDYLVDNGVDVNAIDMEGNTPIFYALSEGRAQLKFIRPIVEAGADINHKNQRGFVPVFLALNNTSLKPSVTIELTEELIALGADITHVGEDGTNARWIVTAREKEVVDYVISKGVTDYRVPDGYYADCTLFEKLMRSMNANDIDTFKSCFIVNKLNRDEQLSLLGSAINNNRVHFVKAIVEGGVPAYLRDSHNVFPFQKAQELRYNEIKDYLKANMADYYLESKKRIAKAKPVYDRLIESFMFLDEQIESTRNNISPDLSCLDEFVGHPFMERYEPWQLAQWARSSVSPKNVKISSDVDNDFNVIFSKTNRFTGTFIVKIDMGSEPVIVGFSS
jgi:hypothetical protein